MTILQQRTPLHHLNFQVWLHRNQYRFFKTFNLNFSSLSWTALTIRLIMSFVWFEHIKSVTVTILLLEPPYMKLCEVPDSVFCSHLGQVDVSLNIVRPPSLHLTIMLSVKFLLSLQKSFYRCYQHDSMSVSPISATISVGELLTNSHVTPTTLPFILINTCDTSHLFFARTAVLPMKKLLHSAMWFL